MQRHTNESSDHDIMSTPDFFEAGGLFFYRADAGVFTITLDAITLDEREMGAIEETSPLDRFEESHDDEDDGVIDAEFAVDEDGEIELEEDEIEPGIWVRQVGDRAIEEMRAKAVDTASLSPLVLGWLFAVSDAIDEAGGVPEAVTPPSPAQRELAA